MTERQKRMIEGYLPHPRDKTLDFDEYYVQDTAGRVRRVRIGDIFPHGDYLTYVCYESTNPYRRGKRIDAGWGDPYIGFTKGYLYDNRQDCKDDTHNMFDDWEDLRKIQEEEADADNL